MGEENMQKILLLFIMIFNVFFPSLELSQVGVYTKGQANSSDKLH